MLSLPGLVMPGERFDEEWEEEPPGPRCEDEWEEEPRCGEEEPPQRFRLPRRLRRVVRLLEEVDGVREMEQSSLARVRLLGAWVWA